MNSFRSELTFEERERGDTSSFANEERFDALRTLIVSQSRRGGERGRLTHSDSIHSAKALKYGLSISPSHQSAT